MGLNIEFHAHPISNFAEYLSKLDDMRSVKFNHDHKVMVTSGDHKFEPLILCPHPIAITLKLLHKI